MTQGAAAPRGGGGPWEVCRESGSAGLPTREGPRHSPSTNVPNWPAGHETTRSCGGWRQTGSNVVCERVARNPHTPADVQSRLAHDDKTEVRRAVAENPAAPEKVLEKLAGDATFVVRAAVATNPATGTGLLEQLAADPTGYVRRAVAANPAAPTETKLLAGLVQIWADRHIGDVNRRTIRRIRNAISQLKEEEARLALDLAEGSCWACPQPPPGSSRQWFEERVIPWVWRREIPGS